MEPALPVPERTPRGDFLLSLAVVGLTWTPDQVAALARIATRLARRYQFWEIVVVASIEEEVSSALAAQLGAIPNMRLLRVDEVDNFYRLRLAAASEAIGDVVVITTGSEMELMDLPALADKVWGGDEAIVMIRERQGILVSVFFGILGSLINYRIDPRDTLTAGFPRTWLSRVLARPDADLLLRFERRTGGGHFRRETVPGGVQVPRALRSVGRRFRLLADLLASAAPRVLRTVSAFSFAVALFAVVYGVYAVLIWLLKDNVQPGWLTTSLVQVVIVGFLGVTVAGISIGIVKLLDRIEGMLRYTIVDELNTVDFFSKVTDLNVERRHREPEEEAS
ncbi:hypothetical protein [Aquabacter cavernae]|uniref:hypothetical protein n=1 Tax=Aquabacter cavernae TaxID=2496029 RepID=UPI000F8C389F|nr:hypothetical protein [Aquabacter cavernae]